MFKLLKDQSYLFEHISFKQFKEMVAIYFLLKIFAIILIYNIFEPLFARPFFHYGDWEAYNDCKLYSPNFLYSLSICLLDIEAISDLKAILLGLFLNTLKDLFFIIITCCCVNKRTAIIFILFLSLHPFLALYHLRYVTTCFASVCLLMLFAYEVRSTWLKSSFFSNKFLIVACGVLVGFRYAILVPVLSYLTFKYIRNIYFTAGLFIFSVASFFISWNYMSSFINYSLNGTNDFSLNNIQNTLNLKIFPILDIALSFCFYFVVNLITLMGFREGSVLTFHDYFFPLDAPNVLELLMFLSFSVFHLLGIIYFCIHFRKYKAIVFCVIANIVVCCLFLTHIRYFIHLMPLALIGFSILCNKIFYKNI